MGGWRTTDTSAIDGMYRTRPSHCRRLLNVLPQAARTRTVAPTRAANSAGVPAAKWAVAFPAPIRRSIRPASRSSGPATPRTTASTSTHWLSARPPARSAYVDRRAVGSGPAFTNSIASASITGAKSPGPVRPSIPTMLPAGMDFSALRGDYKDALLPVMDKHPSVSGLMEGERHLESNGVALPGFGRAQSPNVREGTQGR